MKNTKFTKIFLVILTLALSVGAVFAMGVSAEEPAETKTPDIISQNLEYNEKFKLMYAVDTATVAEGKVTLNVYNMDPSVNPAAIPLATMEVEKPTTDTNVLGNLGVSSAYIFTTTAGVGYGDMVINYYAQAIDSQGNKSAVKRYSVAEYFYQRLATPGISDDQKTLYTSALEFGNNVQKSILNVTAKDELISNLRYVTIEGGTLGGHDAGLYPVGSTVALEKYDVIAAEWSINTYASADATPTTTTATKSFKVADAVKTEIKLGKTVNYRPEVDNFDDKTTSSALDGVTAQEGIEAGYVESENHGMVLSATMTGINHLQFNKISTELADSNEATALELSFDFKFDSPNDDNTASIAFDFYRGSSRNRLYLYNYEGKLRFRNMPHSYEWTDTTFDFPENGWFHLRMVIYESDNTNIYYYINGSETPVIQNIYSPWPIKEVTSFDFYMENGNGVEPGTNLQFDNLFFGYTKDTKPAQ